MTPNDIALLPYRPCVGVMLVNPSGHVFVGQRIDSELDAWQMPQGGIDPGESVREAALRELWEETGLEASSVRIEAETEAWLKYELPHALVPKLWKGRFRGQEQKWVLMRFTGDDGQVDIAKNDREFSEWRWMAPGDLLDNIVPFKRRVYEGVLSAFGPQI
ncbi:RNA pyrophosphohydrolase [Roseovarius sp. LXJ103]|uniref:RNA pyrophosphohydrolase n=1 Tax=Roseovarius carneus TaxID=2853164 RepID=UPI000D61A4A5|nr:RNA pyrophosphohydrolase [Roseovarius carneus]MBZ8118129.1 RNA pyrophosphohydrolase [Roseovarius carneus]PWE36136.1 RNA pyrophosphohydrolase [Pelagicola sp. LXJ1103]